MAAPTKSSNAPKAPALTSSLLSDLGFRHGFYTRQGGVSAGVFGSLNFAANTGDSAENVAENLERVGRHLGVQASHIHFMSQVHGTDYVVAERHSDAQKVRQQQGDIVLTREAEIAAAIRTADCVPILFACPLSGWVAACHSGWMGCVRGAAIATVEALRQHGAQELYAAIGPHISLEAFEVGADVAQQLLDASPDKSIVQARPGKPHVDLRAMVHAQLHKSGIAADHIDDVPGCTVLEPEQFFSYRRDKNPSGRMLSAIVGGKPSA